MSGDKYQPQQQKPNEQKHFGHDQEQQKKAGQSQEDENRQRQSQGGYKSGGH